MLDIGWSELLVIAVVAVIVVGPKDLPRMLRGFGNFVGRMKRMSRDFQRQFNDALREAELEDVKKSVDQIGKINPLADVKKELNPIRKMGDEIRRELGVPVPAAGAAAAAKAAEAKPAEANPAAPQPGVNLAVPLNGEAASAAANGEAKEAGVATPAVKAAANGSAAATAAPEPAHAPVNGSGQAPASPPGEAKP
jgi:sec-independent protein translocase protein TatB